MEKLIATGILLLLIGGVQAITYNNEVTTTSGDLYVNSSGVMIHMLQAVNITDTIFFGDDLIWDEYFNRTANTYTNNKICVYNDTVGTIECNYDDQNTGGGLAASVHFTDASGTITTNDSIDSGNLNVSGDLIVTTDIKSDDLSGTFGMINFTHKEIRMSDSSAIDMRNISVEELGSESGNGILFTYPTNANYPHKLQLNFTEGYHRSTSGNGVTNVTLLTLDAVGTNEYIFLTTDRDKSYMYWRLNDQYSVIGLGTKSDDEHTYAQFGTYNESFASEGDYQENFVLYASHDILLRPNGEDVLPYDDKVVNLGGPDNEWNTLYVDYIDFVNVSNPGIGFGQNIMNKTGTSDISIWPTNAGNVYPIYKFDSNVDGSDKSSRFTMGGQDWGTGANGNDYAWLQYSGARKQYQVMSKSGAVALAGNATLIRNSADSGWSDIYADDFTDVTPDKIEKYLEKTGLEPLDILVRRENGQIAYNEHLEKADICEWDKNKNVVGCEVGEIGLLAALQNTQLVDMMG